MVPYKVSSTGPKQTLFPDRNDVFVCFREISLDYGFSNGANFISFLWFLAVVVLIAIVVSLLEAMNLPKKERPPKVCITSACSAISYGLVQVSFWSVLGSYYADLIKFKNNQLCKHNLRLYSKIELLYWLL